MHIMFRTYTTCVYNHTVCNPILIIFSQHFKILYLQNLKLSLTEAKAILVVVLSQRRNYNLVFLKAAGNDFLYFYHILCSLSSVFIIKYHKELCSDHSVFRNHRNLNTLRPLYCFLNQENYVKLFIDSLWRTMMGSDILSVSMKDHHRCFQA